MSNPSCPKCNDSDTVLIGKFSPLDAKNIYKCLNCDYEWGIE